MRPIRTGLMRSIAVAILVPLLGACETAPGGPSVMVLPGSGISFEQFQGDDAACREWGHRKATSPGQQREYDIAYQQCMYAKGHLIPGGPPPRGSAAPAPPAPPR